MGSNDFAPDWASAPGETIRDILEERGLSIGYLADRLGQTPHLVQELLAGNMRITNPLAKRLENILGPSATFWMARDSQYQRDSNRLLRKEHLIQEEWLNTLPLKDAVKFGWLRQTESPFERLGICFRFFDVSSVQEWRVKYEHVLADASFRTSPTFADKPGSVALWLRRGEIEASVTVVNDWNPNRFKATLANIRKLIRHKDPEIFVPELKRQCAECGVGVAVIPTPAGCHASGATRFLSPNKALLLLSFRFLSDDHFWFSFFHEAGHLLLHSPERLFLEGTERSQQSHEEAEANHFAQKTLIPLELFSRFRTLRADKREIIKFALRAGVSPGIVVGQLQHFRRLRHDQFNSLKRRYQWGQSD
jgi:plasmid maintenance system antidote protein VapI